MLVQDGEATSCPNILRQRIPDESTFPKTGLSHENHVLGATGLRDANSLGGDPLFHHSFTEEQTLIGSWLRGQNLLEPIPDGRDEFCYQVRHKCCRWRVSWNVRTNSFRELIRFRKSITAT